MKTLKEGTNDLNNALGNEEEAETPTLFDVFAGSKFANVQVGFTGVTINVDPRFVADMCYIYKTYLDASMHHIVALVKSFIHLERVADNVMDKWV